MLIKILNSRYKEKGEFSFGMDNNLIMPRKLLTNKYFYIPFSRLIIYNFIFEIEMIKTISNLFIKRFICQKGNWNKKIIIYCIINFVSFVRKEFILL